MLVNVHGLSGMLHPTSNFETYTPADGSFDPTAWSVLFVHSSYTSRNGRPASRLTSSCMAPTAEPNASSFSSISASFDLRPSTNSSTTFN